MNPRICLLKLGLSFLMVLLIGPFCSAFAQPVERIEFPSSPNPVGSGARALGMGGAFIAVADDATAASWNPGGLIQLETPEVSLVGATFYRSEDNTFGTNPEACGRENVSGMDINYFSLAYPFKLFNHNMIVSLNYQHLYDFTREWDFPLSQSIPVLSLSRVIDYQQTGGLYALGLAYGVQISPTLSFGFTLNFWEDWLGDNEWKQKTKERGSGIFVGFPFKYRASSYDRFSFKGFNANLGLLWNATPRLTVGAVFKTPFTADLKHKHRANSLISFPSGILPDVAASDIFCVDEKLDMPMSYGIGFAYRFSDEFTMSADVYRTEWQDFVLKNSTGEKKSPISGLPISESDIEPTHQVRIGAEYLLIKPKYTIPLRAGVFYDPAPAEGDPDDFLGFSLGSGIAYGRYIFDIAYQYRFGHDVGKSILQALDFSQDVKEVTVYASLIVHF
jgi:long-chain fatty acid transport protein